MARIINPGSLERMIKKQVRKWEGKPVCFRQTGQGDLSKVSWRVGLLGLGFLHVSNRPLLSITMVQLFSELSQSSPKGYPCCSGLGPG